MKIKRTMVTTADNPFCPIKQTEEWSNFDHQHHYNTMEYLMRVARVSPEMEEIEFENEIERAVDIICRLNPLGIYVKVSVETEENETED